MRGLRRERIARNGPLRRRDKAIAVEHGSEREPAETTAGFHEKLAA
jgi:hypothetical protein